MKFLRCSTCLVVAILMILLFTPASHAAQAEGVMMRNGKMMLMKHGKAARPMDEDITLGNGTVISSDGTIKSKGGREFRMRNGQVMMMDGHLMKGGKAAGMAPEVGNPIDRPMLKYPNQ